jgi:hypothetical protein
VGELTSLLKCGAKLLARQSLPLLMITGSRSRFFSRRGSPSIEERRMIVRHWTPRTSTCIRLHRAWILVRFQKQQTSAILFCRWIRNDRPSTNGRAHTSERERLSFPAIGSRLFSTIGRTYASIVDREFVRGDRPGLLASRASPVEKDVICDRCRRCQNDATHGRTGGAHARN